MSIARKGSLARRVAAAAGAVALGLAGLAGAALTANATEPGAGNIEAGKATSLTINKYAGPQDKDHVPDGTVQTPDPSTHTALKGVEFTITPVTAKGDQSLATNAIDTDPKAWDIISGPDGKTPLVAGDVASVDPATNAATAKNGFVLDAANATVVTTDANGVGKLADGTVPTLPHGLYLVTETGHGDNDIVSQTAPFLVTLPLPQTKGSWLYDVNVYPKNQILTGPVKTINTTEEQTGVKVGDTVQYKIEQEVPALNEGETYKDAVIYDNLDNAELKYDSGELLTNSGTALAEGVDYTFSHEVTTTTDTPAKNIENVKWTLTPAGLGKIKKGDTITIVFKAKVLKVTVTGGIANGPGNGEVGKPGYGSKFNGKTVPGTTTPYTFWGNLEVTKIDESNNKLANADFSVYEGGCPADKSQPTGTAVATGTSDSNGLVKWSVNDPATGAAGTDGSLGLFVANVNSATAPDPASFSKDYCVYETKAPAGFIKGDPRTVAIKPGTTATSPANAIDVTNTQQNHPNLPLTGAAGTIVMTLAGIALVAAGGAAYAVSRKRSAR
jgi:fimbrial isopeptide formation D2 family protein/LPXTG-motif cell wall-anchored protein